MKRRASNSKHKILFEIIGFENPQLSDLLQTVFTRLGISVEAIRITPLSAPMTGDHLMRATFVAQLPPEFSRRSAEHAIEEISADLNVVGDAG